MKKDYYYKGYIYTNVDVKSKDPLYHLSQLRSKEVLQWYGSIYAFNNFQDVTGKYEKKYIYADQQKVHGTCHSRYIACPFMKDIIKTNVSIL